MTRPYVDTNVIVRYVTRDDQRLAQQAATIIEQLETGALSATTCEAVLVETVYVLTSRTLYNLPRQTVAAYLTQFVMLRGLRLSDKSTYLRALSLYGSTSLDFSDALIVAHMEKDGATTLYSFDRDFDRLPGITRRES
jgi:predicted nucleic acid-binding protein